MRLEISEIKMFYRNRLFGYTSNSLALSSPVRNKVAYEVYEAFEIELLREFLKIGEILRVTIK